MQRDAGLLVDMTQAASRIVLFRGQMDFEQFRNDPKTQSAIIHQFLIIGEVAKYRIGLNKFNRKTERSVRLLTSFSFGLFCWFYYRDGEHIKIDIKIF